MARILTAMEIRELVTGGQVIQGADPDCAEGIKYDFRLGDRVMLPQAHILDVRELNEADRLRVRQLAGVLRMTNIRALLAAVLLLNLSFAGLVSNFPLFSNVRFGWEAAENAFFFAFVGVCAVVTQGFLIGRLQPRLGEERLLIGGLTLMALNLALMAIIPAGFLLYPVVGLLALGAGLAIPSVTSIISNRTPEDMQGRLMGGVQAILSLALILGPVLAGLAFDQIAVPAPYLLGATLAVLALTVAVRALLPRRTAAAQSTTISVSERASKRATVHK